MRKTLLTPMTVKGFQLVFQADPEPGPQFFAIPSWAENEAMTEMLLFSDDAKVERGEVV
jgi:hypothetical protein